MGSHGKVVGVVKVRNFEKLDSQDSFIPKTKAPLTRSFCFWLAIL